MPILFRTMTFLYTWAMGEFIGMIFVSALTSFLPPGSGHTGKKIKSLTLLSICKSAPLAVLSKIQLTLRATRRTPHGAVHLMQQATSASSVKNRRAPSQYCTRDARIMTMRLRSCMILEHPPPPPLLLSPEMATMENKLIH